MAKELNREIDAKLAWQEGEKVAITSIKCMSCNQMVDADAIVCHPCFEEAQKTEPLNDGK